MQALNTEASKKAMCLALEAVIQMYLLNAQ